MPRRLRSCPAGIPVHVVQRGNNHQICFTTDRDMRVYAKHLAEGANKFEVAVNGWVFMTNHVHLLLTPSTDHGISRLMQFLGRKYVRYFNRSYSRSGTLYEGRFKSSLVEADAYFLNCLCYIESNPIRAGMTSDPGDYQWSSYHCHAFGKSHAMWSPHPVYLGLARTPEKRCSAYRRFVGAGMDSTLADRIQQCMKTGIVLGSREFETQVAGARR